MKPSTRKLGIIAVTATVAILSAAALLHAIPPASSQQPPMMEHSMPGHGQQPSMGEHSMPGHDQQPPMGEHSMPGHDQMPGMMMQQMMQMHGHGAGQMGATTPTMPGQDAFGAVQEIVRILEADPKTDWSKIDLEALRQHLIDMDEVTLNADAAAKPIDGGLEIVVTGTGRTLAGIQRMVPAHADMLNQMNGWNARTEPLPNGALLMVTSSDPKEVQHIRGLGFIGLLVSGGHHQPHHLAIAKGELAHAH